ncbi:MAG: iron-sulfur cluster assembly accessory protein [Gemmatales bacterium]
MSAVAELNTPATTPSAPPITVTARAAEEVRRIVEEQRAAGVLAADEQVYLRVSVKGGGCSGFQNKLDLDPNYNAKSDELFEINGVGVVADRKSLLYISGATVDFHNDLNKRGFSVSNPNAKTTCGCGSSFSV